MTLRKTGKTKVDSEFSAKAVNSAKRKQVEDVMDIKDVKDVSICKAMADFLAHPEQ